MTLQKRITLKDIALRAGVHPTTVSLALRNSSELPKETRDRLLELAEQMGYVPDPALSALGACRHSPSQASRYSIAFVTALEEADKWRKNEVCRICYEGVSRRASQLGYHLENFWFDPSSMTRKRATQILRTRNIRGLLITGAHLSNSAPDLEWQHFAVVKTTQAYSEIPAHVVTNDHSHTVRLACAKLGELGYKRIGLAMNRYSDDHVNRVWSVVFRGEQAALPSRCRVPLHLVNTFTKESFLAWKKRCHPDVILTIGPDDAHIVRWLEEEKIKTPEAVGVATLDCIRSNSEISGIYQNTEVLGITSVDTLAGLIQRNDLGWPEYPTEILTRGIWINGKTTRQQI